MNETINDIKILENKNNSLNVSNSQDYGWFEGFEPQHSIFNNNTGPIEPESTEEPIKKALSLPPPITDPPPYVLESSLDSQHLWYVTAGTRPRQPIDERKFYEELWEKNFLESQVKYNEISNPIDEKKENLINLKNEFSEEVFYRGRSRFSTAVSKSFFDHCLSSLTVQIPRFKIVRKLSSNERYHVEFLVTVAIGSVTHGVWRRHSQFKVLYDKIQEINYTNNQAYKNSILSWQCILNRQKWSRCIQKDYVSLKCFLLERFMHDILFESSSPDLIIDFLGLTK